MKDKLDCNNYAYIAITTKTKKLDRLFSYNVPEELNDLVRVGSRVTVPFGNGNKKVDGYVFKISAKCDYDSVKDIIDVVEDLELSEDHIKLALWMRKTYLCSFSDAMNVLTPPNKDMRSSKIRIISLNGDKIFLEEALENFSKRAKKPYEIYEYLKEKEFEREDILKKQFKINSSYVDRLIDANILETFDEEEFKKIDIDNWDDKSEFNLNFDQDAIFNRISESIKLEERKTFLLQGVTGSGKTEVYLKLVEEVEKKGKSSVILVPEISLTPQTVGRFYEKFGEKVAVFHSKLSFRERYDEWRQVKLGLKKVIVGARSAIMAPCRNIGIIILDEEHDGSYKSDRNPKYHAAEVASYLADLNDSVVLLGSATPSINSLHQCDEGNYEKLYMNRRYNNNALPDIKIVDMREELALGNKSIFSNNLMNSVNLALEKKEQVILFLNRKGYSTFVKCRECGYSAKCPNCDISLTYHKYDNTVKCNYCGYSKVIEKKCPECGSDYFRHFGLGTEKVEEFTKEAFEGARVARIDGVVATKKGAVEKVLRMFKRKELDILIGTQMISKGLDFSNVTVVGVLSADILLNIPDYLSSERTFQILTQVSGRAGRGYAGGCVVVQTYSPENFVIDSVSKYDFDRFVFQELINRREFKYPPYYNIANIVFTSEDNLKAEQVAFRVRKLADEIIFKNKLNIEEVLGPNPAVYSKIKNRHRWQIIMKYKIQDFLTVRKLLNFICVTNGDKISYPDVNISVDINSTKLL